MKTTKPADVNDAFLGRGYPYIEDRDGGKYPMKELGIADIDIAEDIIIDVLNTFAESGIEDFDTASDLQVMATLGKVLISNKPKLFKLVEITTGLDYNNEIRDRKRFALKVASQAVKGLLAHPDILELITDIFDGLDDDTENFYKALRQKMTAGQPQEVITDQPES